MGVAVLILPYGSKCLVLIYLPKTYTIFAIVYPKPQYLIIGYLDPLGHVSLLESFQPSLDLLETFYEPFITTLYPSVNLM